MEGMTTSKLTSNAIGVAPPDASEYAAYYGKYIALVPGNDVVRTLEGQGRETAELLAGLSERQTMHRYAPGKWSVKEVVGHVTDSERIFAYRALRIARSDRTPIEGFEQDDYVQAAQFDRRSLAELVAEFSAVREATVRLFESLPADAWMRRGVANQNQVSVRALAYMIAGHELHHRRVLQDKYLVAAAGA
jgi:uncharacterized damage-inducible protein DinB